MDGWIKVWKDEWMDGLYVDPGSILPWQQVLIVNTLKLNEASIKQFQFKLNKTKRSMMSMKAEGWWTGRGRGQGAEPGRSKRYNI